MLILLTNFYCFVVGSVTAAIETDYLVKSHPRSREGTVFDRRQ